MASDAHRTVNVYLTAGALRELASYESDQVIEMIDEDGGLFVHAAENLADEGSGVWVDAEGTVHHGPGLPFTLSDEAVEFERRTRAGL